MSRNILAIVGFIAFLECPTTGYAQKEMIKELFESRSFSEGVDTYISAIKDSLVMDDETKILALCCFVNREDGYVLGKGVKNIGGELAKEIQLFLELSDELIPREQKVACLKMRICAKVFNCIQGYSDSLYKYYHSLFEVSKAVCNTCCIIEKNTGSSRGGITDIKYVNTKVANPNFKPNYGNNDSLKIKGAIPTYNIDSFINEAAIWGNGVDTGIITRCKVNISVEKDGTVSYGSSLGTVMPSVNRSLINSKYKNSLVLTDKLKEIFLSMPKWKTTMTNNGQSGTMILTLWAR